MTDDAVREELLSSQWRKNTLRETFVEDGRIVVKRFLVKRGARCHARPWLREHRALRKLGDGVAGNSHGFVKKTGPEGLEILLRKDFVAGDPIVRLEGAMISRFAELLSRLHSRGVVMCDPNLENFVQDESGEIHCIDYGRAATFALRSPFFYYSIGSEFAKCIHEAFDDDEDRWADFLKAYFDASSAGGFSRWMIDGSFRFAVKSRARRNERR